MKKTLYYTGIAIALILLMLELTYVNARSLLYLVAEFGLIDRIFAVIGAMAFSMVTVLVMRTADKGWMKIAFPVFDALLVFTGFNLRFADNLYANPIAFWLTIFLAMFTALIMYSLGSIRRETTSGLQQSISSQLQVTAGNQVTAAGNEELAATLQESNDNFAANMQHDTAIVQQLKQALKINMEELDRLRAIIKKNEDARTCRKCGRVFESEASKRSHEGKCKTTSHETKIKEAHLLETNK